MNRLTLLDTTSRIVYSLAIAYALRDLLLTPKVKKAMGAAGGFIDFVFDLPMIVAKAVLGLVAYALRSLAQVPVVNSALRVINNTWRSVTATYRKGMEHAATYYNGFGAPILVEYHLIGIMALVAGAVHMNGISTPWFAFGAAVLAHAVSITYTEARQFDRAATRLQPPVTCDSAQH